jgi:hypothetical protein
LYMHPFEPPEKEASTVGNGFTFNSWNTGIHGSLEQKLCQKKCSQVEKRVKLVPFQDSLCILLNNTESLSCQHVNDSDSNQQEDHVGIAACTECTKEMKRIEIQNVNMFS